MCKINQLQSVGDIISQARIYCRVVFNLRRSNHQRSNW